MKLLCDVRHEAGLPDSARVWQAEAPQNAVRGATALPPSNWRQQKNTLRVDNSVALSRTVCPSRACACEKRRRLGHRRVVCLSVRARALRPSHPPSIEDHLQYTSTTARANPITHAASLSRPSFAVQHSLSRLRCIRRASHFTAASFAGAAT